MDDTPDERGRGVTIRATLIGHLLLIVLSIVAFYVTLVYFTSSSFGTGVPASAPYAVLFLLAVLMTIPPVRRVIKLGRRELLVVFSIVLIGAPFVSQSILGWMLPHSIFQVFMGRAVPDWETSFIPLIPTWFTPTDPITVENFFLGRAAVPWSVWLVPLAAWNSFLIAVVGASTFLVLLVQRQWISNERLSFPLAQIPLESVTENKLATGEKVARLPANWWFWAGLLISFVIGVYNSFATWFPALPSIPTGPVTLIPWQRVGPLAGVGDIELILWPWLIALAYLIPKELSFSAWFFWWFRVALTVLAIAAGAFPEKPDEWYGNTFPAPYWQGVGAVLAIAGWTAWTARRHLAQVVKIAFSKASGRADATEPISYRVALIGFVACFVYLVYFCSLAGARVIVGTGLITLILVFYLTWARLRAETGMGFLSFPLKVDNVMLEPFGTAIYKPKEIVTILSTRWSYFPGYGQSPEIFCGNALESMKIAGAAGIKQRALLRVMAIGFLFALGIGIYIMMTGIYHHGYHGLQAATTTTDWWLDQQLQADGTRIFNALQNPTHFELATTIALGAGVVFTVFLGLMRQRFWWWPFHPIGYLAANTWGAKWNWMPLFVGWLLKTLVIRYGGLRLYRKTVPMAIGLIAGDLLSQFVWGIMQAIVRASGAP
ncbi:MAG: hypothetical protein JXA57_03265 [Armatimonadetes bacterium]|nr:hypothetical protein [Armatimonadota bacterium]